MSAPLSASAAPCSLLFTGGTRSGKSALALRWAEGQASRRVFVATARPCDAETALRVTRHQAERGEGWSTCEEPLHVLDVLRRESRPGVVLLVDCVTMWLANMLDESREEDGGRREASLSSEGKGQTAAADAALARVRELALWLPRAPGPVALVTAEVGMGIVPVFAAGRAFRDMQGEANQILARSCSTVLFVACGLPLALKNTVPRAFLP